MKKLIEKLEGYFTENMPKVESAEAHPVGAVQERHGAGHLAHHHGPEARTGPGRCDRAIFDEEDSFAAYFMKDEGITRYDC